MTKSSKRTSKEVKLASLAGFCYGVKRAVDLCLTTKEQNPQKFVCVLGELIHNSQAIEFLKNKGIETINSIEEVPENSICIIRSHGEGPEVFKLLDEKNVEIVNATCPDVKRVQSTAAQLAKEDYQVIIIGHNDHPEVIAIEEHINNQARNKALIISCLEDVENNTDIIVKSKKIGVVVQTTKPMDMFTSILSKISELCYEVRAFNTICNATSKRQKQARELAKEVSFMVIVGGKQSANTTYLAQICKSINPNTVHIQNADELMNYDLDRFETFGVTAGASTPKFVIDEVLDFLRNIGEK